MDDWTFFKTRAMSLRQLLLAAALWHRGPLPPRSGRSPEGKQGRLIPLSTVWKLFRSSVNAGNELENRSAHHHEISEGNKLMRVSGEIILENVRRYRATASLYRQTAAFRPLQKWSLLEQAERWDRLAVAELEDYFNLNSPNNEEEPHVTPTANARCVMVAAA
jgi:hypothetical protein